MKKFSNFILAFIFATAVFTSCDSPSQPEKEEVTVTYYSEYDSQNLPAPLTVEKGYKIKAEDIQPLSDSKNDFVKWETKTGIGITVGYEVDENQTFYAKWTPKDTSKDPEKDTDSDDNNGDDDDDNGTGTGDNGGKQNPPSNEPAPAIKTFSDGSYTETVRVTTADGGYEETVTNKTKAGIVTSVKTVKYTKNADGTETIVTEVPDGTKRRTYTSSKDKNGVWTASSNILKAEPDTTGNGIKFTVKKYNNVDWATDYTPRFIEKDTSLTVFMPSITEAVKAQEYVLYFPYVQSGKTYEFTFKGNNINGYGYSDLIRVTAGEGIGETNNDFDIAKWNTIKPCCKYYSGDEHFWCGFEHSFTNLLDLIKNDTIKSSCHIDFGVVFGATDWHPGDWKTGNSICLDGSNAITYLNAPIVKCEWGTTNGVYNLDDLSKYENKYFMEVNFNYSTEIGNFCKIITSEQFTYEPVSLPNFYVGNWESNYYWFGGNVVHETVKINSDGSYENLRYKSDGTYQGWRGFAEVVDDTTMYFYHNQYKDYSDSYFNSSSLDETISFEKIDNDHFIMKRSDGSSSPRMYEREGSAFDVNINDVVGDYKAEEGDLIIKNDGNFVCNVDEEVYRRTVTFVKNKFTIEITKPEEYKGKDYGMYVPGIVFVSGYKFIKQRN